MRLARTALFVSVILLGATSLRAQTAHSVSGSCQGCGQCASCQGCGNGECCQALLPTIAQGLQSVLGGIIPGHTGCDARHKVYKAALQRSTFDKKCLIPVAYYSHIFPFWSKHRCCCGPVSPNCPTCGPTDMIDEQIIEMHEYPEGMPMEPTPAMEQEAPRVPDEVIEPKEARRHQPTRRTAKRPRPTPAKQVASEDAADQVARHDDAPRPSSALRWLAPARPTDSTVRQVSAVETTSRREPTNPLR